LSREGRNKRFETIKGKTKVTRLGSTYNKNQEPQRGKWIVTKQKKKKKKIEDQEINQRPRSTNRENPKEKAQKENGTPT